MVRASSDASRKGSRSASASKNIMLLPRHADFCRARCTIGWQKSVPITVPADARLRASARSPVPQQRSATTEDGLAKTGLSALTVACRHRMSRPTESRWLSRSYRGATAANIFRTAEAVDCSSAAVPRVVPSAGNGFVLDMRLRQLHTSQGLNRRLDGDITDNPDRADLFRHHPMDLAGDGLFVTREKLPDFRRGQVADGRQRSDPPHQLGDPFGFSEIQHIQQHSQARRAKETPTHSLAMEEPPVARCLFERVAKGVA